MWTPLADDIKRSQCTVAASSEIVLMLLLVEFAANWHVLPNYMPHNCIYCQRSRWQMTRVDWDTRPELEGKKIECFSAKPRDRHRMCLMTYESVYLVNVKMFLFGSFCCMKTWKKKMHMVVSNTKAAFTADLFAIHSQWDPLCRPHPTPSAAHSPHSPACLHQSVRSGVNAA